MWRHHFAHPWLLAFLALLPALGVLALWARRRRRLALARIGSPVALEGMLTGRRRPRLLRGLSLLLGMACLGLGAAGPQWGRDWGQAAAPGRDLVVVVDCSRSMLAETPSRLERCREALLDLCRAVQRRGGHRLALVFFAGRARLVCPLTHDYDHFRDTLARLPEAPFDPDLQPGPGDTSGTRIGRGLREALAAHDPRFPGARDILLLSDGDDPAAHQGEWRQAAAEARGLNIPVHTVAIGDPDTEHRIRIGNGYLRHGGQEVRSRLHEAPLREIAHTTRGLATLARTDTLPLGDLYLGEIASLPVREDTEDALPVYRQHFALFLAPAFALLATALTLGDRARRADRMR